MEPSPSCPLSLVPQQRTAPSVRTAQVEISDPSGNVIARTQGNAGPMLLIEGADNGVEYLLTVRRRPDSVPSFNDFYVLYGGSDYAYGEIETAVGQSDSLSTAEPTVDQAPFVPGMENFYSSHFVWGRIQESGDGQDVDVDYRSFWAEGLSSLDLFCHSKWLGSGLVQPRFAVLDSNGQVLRESIETSDKRAIWGSSVRGATWLGNALSLPAVCYAAFRTRGGAPLHGRTLFPLSRGLADEGPGSTLLALRSIARKTAGAPHSCRRQRRVDDVRRGRLRARGVAGREAHLVPTDRGAARARGACRSGVVGTYGQTGRLARRRRGEGGGAAFAGAHPWRGDRHRATNTPAGSGAAGGCRSRAGGGGAVVRAIGRRR